jgi:hypothetical protein
VSYHVLTHVTVPSLQRDRIIDRSVMVRTKDDVAVIQDLPKGSNQIGNGFPVTPVFDALSYFSFEWVVGFRDTLHTRVYNVTPLRYDDPKATSKADVVVVNLRYYHAAYAPDSSTDADQKTHIVLDPYQFYRDQTQSTDPFYLTDLYIDNGTGLPTRVRMAAARDSEFVVDYGTVDGRWLITHAHYETTYVAPLHAARVHGVADAAYDQFSFPATAPDPRLRE